MLNTNSLPVTSGTVGVSEAFVDAPGGLCVFGVGLWLAHGLEEQLKEGVMENKMRLEPAGLSRL